MDGKERAIFSDENSAIVLLLSFGIDDVLEM